MECQNYAYIIDKNNNKKSKKLELPKSYNLNLVINNNYIHRGYITWWEPRHKNKYPNKPLISQVLREMIPDSSNPLKEINS